MYAYYKIENLVEHILINIIKKLHNNVRIFLRKNMRMTVTII